MLRSFLMKVTVKFNLYISSLEINLSRDRTNCVSFGDLIICQKRAANA